MKICPILVAAVGAFSTIAISPGTAGATAGGLLPHCSAVSLPPDPSVPEAIITRVCLDRAKIFQDSSLSIFFVDVPPGASVMLHRMPSPGYVLVYVLSGTISASAWHAGVGTYRAGETWVEPAFANSIAAENPSAHEPARTLVVVVTKSQEPDNPSHTTFAK